MNIVDILDKYIDIGVEQEEMNTIATIALMSRLKKLKLAIADAVIQSQAALLADNLEGQQSSLQQAMQLGKEHHHFYEEFQQLKSEESEE